MLVNGDVPQLRSIGDTADRKGLISMNSVSHPDADSLLSNELMCFNIGREIYVYVYR